MDSLKLASGWEIPVLGLGTWDLKGEDCKRAIKDALSLGYTHFDTAWMYENQKAIGEALKETSVDRAGLFITSKVWRSHLHYEGVLEQCDGSLRDLQTPYLDLFLVHWPNDAVPMKETFRALKRIVAEGKARSIGVSNFTVAHMKEALRASEVPVSLNQIKYHPGAEDRDVLRWCSDNGVVVTAYSPLGRGGLLKKAPLTEIGERHGKTSAQVSLRWLVEKGLVVIPKASSKDHMRENTDLAGWTLSPDEVERISSMSEGGWLRRVLRP